MKISFYLQRSYEEASNILVYQTQLHGGSGRRVERGLYNHSLFFPLSFFLRKTGNWDCFIKLKIKNLAPRWWFSAKPYLPVPLHLLFSYCSIQLLCFQSLLRGFSWALVPPGSFFALTWLNSGVCRVHNMLVQRGGGRMCFFVKSSLETSVQSLRGQKGKNNLRKGETKQSRS